MIFTITISLLSSFTTDFIGPKQSKQQQQVKTNRSFLHDAKEFISKTLFVQIDHLKNKYKFCSIILFLIRSYQKHTCKKKMYLLNFI